MERQEDGQNKLIFKGQGPVLVRKDSAGNANIWMRTSPAGVQVINARLNKGINYKQGQGVRALFYIFEADGKPCRWQLKFEDVAEATAFSDACETNK